jgi:sodium/potassium/calcium exchanger 2
MVNLKHMKARFSDGKSWKNPEVIGLNVVIVLFYVVGLMCFHKTLDTFKKTAIQESEIFEDVYSSKVNKKHFTHRKLLQLENETAAEPDPLFPEDLFTEDQRKQGAVIFHVIGLIYMFVALAIVCDEFFVPSLDVIIEKLGISEDVAGATFMAAGGSAPELFTSVIGVFVAFSDVGIGTIVGSAVFNILFVIGMCALFSKTVLYLTWWPLFRDCTFYSISLMVLIIFFLDNQIEWWEALGLLSVYCMYVIFMKFNAVAESLVKKIFSKNRVTSTDHLVPSHHSAAAALAGVTGGAMAASTLVHENRHRPSTGIPVLHSGSHFRHGLLQLMIHTIDPLHDGKVDEKATQLHAIASLKVLLDATKPQEGSNGTSGDNHYSDANDNNQEKEGDFGELEELEPEPLDMSIPSHSLTKTITYFILLPIVFPLWLTLPDTRKKTSRKFFAITFVGSILWIAVFSYLMVWWATITGDTVGLPPEVMGLTFLAAGTSIPDLITSVIVARKGFGDMAVSSSVGSNIFDVTVGLPLPWFLYTCVFSQPISVSSEGLGCSIILLFSMLIAVFMCILVSGWKMSKILGMSMFVLYFIFVAVSLAFEYEYIHCPL